MNVVLIDSDCRKHFPDEGRIKELLKDPQCKTHYLSSADFPKIESGCRCVLISAMNSGLKKYHQDLVASNPQVRCWTFAILDTPFKSEQNQLLDNINTVFAKAKVPYTVIFDEAVTLEDTAAVCAVPVTAKKTCLVVSNNTPLAQQFCQVLASWVEEWDVISPAQEPEKFYDSADVILAVGNEEQDFQLVAPKYGMGRIFAWVESKNSSVETKRQMVFEVLTGLGWSLNSTGNVYSSRLELETYHCKIFKGTMNSGDLSNDENFIAWDIYGLPLLARDYTDEAIREFLSQQCCFSKLLEKF